MKTVCSEVYENQPRLVYRILGRSISRQSSRRKGNPALYFVAVYAESP